MHPFSLEGKKILVTGASSGIGRSIAIECSKNGASLVITARNKDRLQETFDLLEGFGHTLILADLSINTQLEYLVEQMPKLDGFIGNAGLANSLLCKFITPKDIDEVFKVNTFSQMNLMQMFLERKIIKKGASIIFTSSVSGTNCGYIGGSIYGASKAALEGFSKALALELAPRNIRVNTINPGMIETDLLNNSNISSEQLKEDALKFPLKRYGKPEEVAFAAVYLLSDATSWMTGTNLLLDGGYTLQ